MFFLQSLALLDFLELLQRVRFFYSGGSALLIFHNVHKNSFSASVYSIDFERFRPGANLRRSLLVVYNFFVFFEANK